MEDWVEKLKTFATEYGLAIIGALLILIIGRWISKLMRRVVRRMLEGTKADAVLVTFLGHLTYALLMTFTIIAALAAVGVQTASFIAVIGAAGLAIGLALQGSLANFAAGVMLIVFRPFKPGDFVEAGGVMGVVEEIDIFVTKLTTPDNKAVIVPNSQVTGGNITNYTKKDTRRVDLVVGVSYGDDLKKVKQVITDVLSRDPRILKDPAPTVGVLEMADSSINLAVRPWTTPADYWGVYFDTLEALKLRFDAENITIPFPQRDVHMVGTQ